MTCDPRMVLFIYTPYIWPLLFAGLVQIWLALYCFRHRDVNTAIPLGLLLFCGAFWAFQSVLQVSVPVLQVKIVLMQALFIVVPFFSYLEISLVLHYLKKDGWIHGWRSVPLLIVPCITVILALTGSFHALWRYNFSVDTTGPFPVLLFTNGPWMTVYLIFSYTLIFTAFFLFFFVQSDSQRVYQRQRLLMLFSLALPTIADLLFQLGITPIRGFPFAPLVMVISGPIFAFAIFRYGFLVISPVARNLVVEGMSAPMIVIDPQGKIIDLNSSATAFLGTGPDSVIGNPAAEVFARYPALLELSRGTAGSSREIAKGSGTSLSVFEGTAESLTDVSGNNLGTCILLRDITRSTLAEAALRESEKKYRTIIEEMQDMFYRTDLAGRITMISPSGVKLSGYDSEDQIIGMDAAELYAVPDNRKKFLEVLGRSGSVYGYPETLRRRDGILLTVTMNSHFYRDARGNVQGVEGVIHDITDLRQAEDAIRMANKKLNLLSGITRHDIHNQLTALKVYLQLSGEHINNPPELANFLGQAQKISDTIEHQIGFTRLYEDMGVNAPVWQNVSGCIGRAVAGLPMRDIGIDAGRTNLEIFADPLLEKVFYNLIDNALRYGGDNLTGISITSRADGASLVLVVADNGAGVPEADKTRLFGKGFGKNTGLGLFLSREILSITGITIAENGVFGTGARFEMTVPAGGFRFGKTAD
ncbi:MAG: histidine kinase N-terminal 7TM domain-containing protein [Methanoregula sp.]